MTKIYNSINKLEQKADDYFARKKESALKQTKEHANDLNNLYNFLDIEKLQEFKTPETNELFELVKIGKLSAKDLYGKKINAEIPLLLPFTKNTATLFFVDKQNSKSIHNIFQTIALRFILSVPPNLANYHFIDINYGRDFATLSNIKNKIVKKIIITSQEGINETIKKLSEKITTANQEFLSNYTDITEYNKTAGSMASSYDFVFIANFPNGFTENKIENLYNMINNFNATRAGIYFFISYDKKIKLPYNTDISKLTNITTNIFKTKNNEYKIQNLDILNKFKYDYFVSFDSKLPENLSNIIDNINEMKQKTVKLSFKTKFDKMMQTNKIWQKETTFGINMPIGFINKQELHYFKLGKENKSDTLNTEDFHVLIGGIPGFGKTILLHNIIINSAMQYSPLDLNFYLIDCANGIGFNPYTNLPHTKIISTSNEIEYAKSILENVTENEFEKRAKLFKNANVADFTKYNQKSKNKIPRLVFIIDEFQVLLENNIVSAKIENMLVKLTKLGRKYGINLILCTQGVGDLNFNTKNLTRRYVFSLGSIESERILGNDAATLLNKPGSSIMNNTQHGKKQANINLQIAFLDDNKDLYTYIDYLDKQFKEKYPDKKLEKFISDGEISSNLFQNKKIIENLFKVNDIFCDIYVGEPAFIRYEHSYFRIRKQSKSNLLIVGNDIASAVSILGLSMYQLIKQSSENSRFYLFDMFNIDNKFNGKLDILTKFSENVKVGNINKIPTFFDEIENELNKRIEQAKNGKSNTGRIILSFAYFRNNDYFEKEPNSYEEPKAKKQLFNFIKKGPDYGIHTILYALDFTNLTEVLEYQTIDDFENRIALYQGDALRIIKDDNGSIPKEKGLALIQAPDGVTSYPSDLFKIYSEIEIPENYKSKNTDIQILKQIF